MKIPLDHKIFTEDPYAKFAEAYDVPRSLWIEMYHKRYLWYQYEIPMLAEYFNLRTKKNLHQRTIRRWIKRTEVYNTAKKAIKGGAVEVTPSFFTGIVTEDEAREMFKHSEIGDVLKSVV